MEVEGGGTAGYVTMAILSIPALIGFLVAIILILMGISMISQGGLLPGATLTLLGAGAGLGIYYASKYIITL